MKNLIWGLIFLIIGILLLVFIYNNFEGFFRKLSLPKFSGNDRGSQQVVGDREKELRVYISGVRPGGYYLGSNYGYVSLINNSNFPVNVTGWKIETNKSSFPIPQAIEDYNPSGINSKSDIVLNPRAQLTIFTHSSAIGENILINKCMGYLQNNINFEPQLPRICPRISREEVAQLSGICQNYLMSFSNCRVPSSEDSVGNDFACGEKLKELSYLGCFSKHGSDPDFFTNQWYVWGSGAILDPYHDIVRIIDEEGFVVSDYIY